MPAVEARYKFFDKIALPATESGCWLWTASRFQEGYGNLNMAGGTHYAHAVSYELFVGPIPEGMFAYHKCNNRACVNPEHLFICSRTVMANRKRLARKRIRSTT